MLRSLCANRRLLATLLLGALVALLTGFVLDQTPVGLSAQTFQSPIQTLSSPLPIPEIFPTPPATCPPQTRWSTLEVDVEVVGLEGAERAVLSVQPVLERIDVCLTVQGVTLPEMTLGNGRHQLQLEAIPDGAYYKLKIQGPSNSFHDPAGYLFQVQDGQIVRRPGFPFQFRLVPPAEQNLPPC